MASVPSGGPYFTAYGALRTPLRVRCSDQPLSEIDRISSQYLVSLRMLDSRSVAALSRVSVAQSRASIREPFMTSVFLLCMYSSCPLLGSSSRNWDGSGCSGRASLTRPSEERGTFICWNMGV